MKSLTIYYIKIIVVKIMTNIL